MPRSFRTGEGRGYLGAHLLHLPLRGQNISGPNHSLSPTPGNLDQSVWWEALTLQERGAPIQLSPSPAQGVVRLALPPPSSSAFFFFLTEEENEVLL